MVCCVFSLVEELLTDFFQLIHASIKTIVPKEESNDAEDNGGSSDDKSLAESRNAMLKKGPGLGGFMAVLTTMQSTVEKPRELEESSSESELDGSEEEFVVHPEDYPTNLQLIYYLLIRNAEIVDADMRYYVSTGNLNCTTY